MVWVGRDLKDHLVPTPLPWAGTPYTRPGCSKPCPTWPLFFLNARWVRWGIQTAHRKLRNDTVLTSIPIPWHSNTPCTLLYSPAVRPYAACTVHTTGCLCQVLPKSPPARVLMGSTTAAAFSVLTWSCAPFWPTQKAPTGIISLTALITVDSLPYPSLHTHGSYGLSRLSLLPHVVSHQVPQWQLLITCPESSFHRLSPATHQQEQRCLLPCPSPCSTGGVHTPLAAALAAWKSSLCCSRLWKLSRYGCTHITVLRSEWRCPFLCIPTCPQPSVYSILEAFWKNTLLLSEYLFWHHYSTGPDSMTRPCKVHSNTQLCRDDKHPVVQLVSVLQDKAFG